MLNLQTNGGKVSLLFAASFGYKCIYLGDTILSLDHPFFVCVSRWDKTSCVGVWYNIDFLRSDKVVCSQATKTVERALNDKASTLWTWTITKANDAIRTSVAGVTDKIYIHKTKLSGITNLYFHIEILPFGRDDHELRIVRIKQVLQSGTLFYRLISTNNCVF